MLYEVITRMIKSPPMDKHRKKRQRLIWLTIVMLVTILLLQRSDIEPGDLTQRVRAFTREIEFDYAGWGRDALILKARQVGLGVIDYLPVETQKIIVLDYLNLIGEISQAEGELYEIYADPGMGGPGAAWGQAGQGLEDL